MHDGRTYRPLKHALLTTSALYRHACMYTSHRQMNLAWLQVFHLPAHHAAQALSLSPGEFKRACKAAGITHWPYRKVACLHNLKAHLLPIQDQGLLLSAHAQVNALVFLVGDISEIWPFLVALFVSLLQLNARVKARKLSQRSHDVYPMPAKLLVCA